MNFFEAQARAKRSSAILILLFLVAISGLILLTAFFTTLTLYYIQYDELPQDLQSINIFAHPQTLLLSTLGVLAVVIFGTLSKYLSLRQGGKSIALLLGGKKISMQTQDSQKRILLNVVEEMSIASGVMMPEVYLLKEAGINAFAAGFNRDDMVIGITQGAVTHLNREELQGVIAHEFSHIFNGDMHMNMRITSLLQGIVMIGNSGRFILRVLFRPRGSITPGKSRSKEEKGGGQLIIALIVLGIGLTVIGFVGSLLGMIIKARVSQKREYLADATAVQYTRYPKGIAGALKKIGALAEHSSVSAPSANTYSHFFFADAMENFWDKIASTHPPLVKRIKALDPYFSGKFRPFKRSEETQRAQTEHTPQEPHDPHDYFKKRAVVDAAVTTIIADVGLINEEALIHSKERLETISEALLAALKEPLTTQALFLLLLSDKSPDILAQQWQKVKQCDTHLAFALLEVKKIAETVTEKEILTLLSLSLPTLKELTKRQYMQFKSLLNDFIHIDKKVTLFEFTLFSSITRPLDRFYKLAPSRIIRHTHLGALKKEAEILFSFLCYEQYQNNTQASFAFQEVIFDAKATALCYQERALYNNEAVFQSIEEITYAGLGLKKRLLEIAVRAVESDGLVEVREHLFIEAMAKILDLPLALS